ncbi:MAG: AAA family ATPase [Pseudonocardiaceae bacterium]|nr:AAA family ATPase [Pseudonocardiaceae bacterium]
MGAAARRRERGRPVTAIATAFDVCGALPTGTTVLEASAGTGKTFTIAALAARYVAEGRATLPELMLVTFGRAATHELRERVRERLVSAERGLADPARASQDQLLALLADAADEEVALRRRRLTTALAQFDAATIATTHQFCQQMLTSLGITGDTDPDAMFVADVDDLVDEVVDDFYVRKYAPRGDTAGDPGGGPAFTRELAGTIAHRAVTDGQARLEPRTAPDGSTAQVRCAFAGAVRREVDRRKRRRRIYTYDDMLTRLSATLLDPSRSPAACARLRERYRVVLVDEFQDTDPVQWDILRTAFSGHTDLVLIGDPKQAIYAFRGADVVSYLAASESAGSHATLATNWRSDEPLLSALDTMFHGAALGDERIVVRPVAAAHREQRLAGAPVTTPLRLRVVGRDGLPQSHRHLATVGPARERVATDAASDIAALLAAGASLRNGDGQRRVTPGDVAVLVRTNAQGDLIRDALAAAGVPAVVTGTASVFATATATQWLTLLEALEQPQRTGRVRAAALTCFLGRTVADLDAGGDGALEGIGLTLRYWANVLADRGVAALVAAVTAGVGLPQRLLATVDGERRLTDLRHIGQALHAAAAEGHLGVTALVGWLRRRIAEAGTETAPDRSRRLESDADAVQIVTVHRSKGLEFPVVYVPFGWDRYVRTDPELLLLHDDGHRVLDVGGSAGPGWHDRLQRHQAEEAGEDLRLLYVAMTRAQCQVVTWWAPTTTTAKSPLHRLLFGRSGPGADPPQSVTVRDDTTVLRHLVGLLQQLGSAVLAVEPVDGSRPLVRWQPPADAAPSLRAATFARQLDLRWRRTSYSALTAAAHAAVTEQHGVGSEPEGGERDDEEMPPVRTAVAADSAVAAMPSPMADLPTGAAFGTLVHAVLEDADPTVPDLLTELTERAREQLARRPTAGLDAETLAATLLPSLQTPLGPLADGRRLADVAASDRLSEIEFELPLAGGDRPTADLTLSQLAPLLRRHLDPAGPLARYPDLLQAPALSSQRLRGYLTGSVDAVLRIPGSGVPGSRFLVVDYKTNWLGEIGPTGPAPLTASHYSPPALADAMIAAHYPLQALLYSVALHRFLRWRQPGYQPDHHLGGVLYLFLRGMCGPDTPTVGGVPCGVFGWRPPAALITDLSRLLDEGAAA